MHVSAINPESTLAHWRIRFRDGRVWTVMAATWRRFLPPVDQVKFYDVNNVENDQVYFRAEDISAIAPDSELDVEPPLSILQNEVKSLAARVDSLEGNLAEIVIRAVIDAFAQRGL